MLSRSATPTRCGLGARSGQRKTKIGFETSEGAATGFQSQLARARQFVSAAEKNRKELCILITAIKPENSGVGCVALATPVWANLATIN